MRAEARARDWAEILIFCQVNNARLCRFPVSQISRNLHTGRGSMSLWIRLENICENLPGRAVFFPKRQLLGVCLQRLRIQAAISPKWLQSSESHDSLASLHSSYIFFRFKLILILECGQMPNVMAAVPNIGGALCSTPEFGWRLLLECRAVTLQHISYLHSKFALGPYHVYQTACC